MKYIIISDSHGNKKSVEDLLANVQHDGVIFVGDGLSDFDNVHGDTLMVRGNCDFFSTVPTIVSKNINGTKVLITHGHLFGVKSGLGALISEAEKGEYDLVIFGHTHETYFEKIGNITYFNPGSFKKDIFGKSTYGVVDFKENTFLINLLEF